MDENGSAGKIMIVDDTLANLRLLGQILRDEDYRVFSFPRGDLALEAALKILPDLILLDINMPEMNGYEVCRRLKLDVGLKEIPVVFISALNESVDKVKAFEVGGIDYVTKPFQVEEVYARVKTHLRIHRQQLQIEDQLNQLRKLEELRDNLIHMLIHDMRNPLAGIQGYLHLLDLRVKEKLDATESDFLGIARDQVNILVEMIGDVLDVSRMEEDKLTPNLQSCDLLELVEKAKVSLGVTSARVHCGPLEKNLRVFCDPDLIRRVCANLLGNALKFINEDESVRVEFSDEERHVKIEVIDEGPGIPLEYQETIFNKFGRVETAQNHKKFSTGLGLTFCKMAVEAHGGSIGVESEEGKGSTFWFTLKKLPE